MRNAVGLNNLPRFSEGVDIHSRQATISIISIECLILKFVICPQIMQVRERLLRLHVRWNTVAERIVILLVNLIHYLLELRLNLVLTGC
jgi:hypothetical protein